ncbi:hypothetical protein UFOVP280_48 [uncultured Caudovirales phage]|uniref:Uncharacterized protein n=1 Tax=uncultured Caudovirales phage TaxID=2100421 RepID=A0A6J5LNR8_9CAUD|nr:hypothetical protein UFOVP280_48 [uncultured Caudovirales phage]
MATSIKISQLPAKSSNLEATDLLEVSEFNGTGYVSKSITGQEIIDSVPSSVTAWGTITGTLSSQTDLNTALSGKQATVTLTTTGTSGASTFVANTLNVPTYSLSGLGGVPTTRTLTINGTTQDLSADRTFTVSTGITIGTTAITSGTVGRVLFEGTGNVVQESANLFWDNTNGRLGIGTSSPANVFSILSNLNTSAGVRVQNTNAGSSAVAGLDFLSNSTQGSLFATSSTYATYGVLSASSVGFYTTSSFNIAVDSNTANFSVGIGSGNPSAKFRIVGSTGNVLINTTTDAGFKLDVNGTARVQNKLSVGTPTQATAVMEITSTTQGFLPPRMTTTQKNAIASPATGLMVYDTTLNVITYYNGTTWI